MIRSQHIRGFLTNSNRIRSSCFYFKYCIFAALVVLAPASTFSATPQRAPEKLYPKGILPNPIMLAKLGIQAVKDAAGSVKLYSPNVEHTLHAARRRQLVWTPGTETQAIEHRSNVALAQIGTLQEAPHSIPICMDISRRDQPESYRYLDAHEVFETFGVSLVRRLWLDARLPESFFSVIMQRNEHCKAAMLEQQEQEQEHAAALYTQKLQEGLDEIDPSDDTALDELVERINRQYRRDDLLKTQQQIDVLDQLLERGGDQEFDAENAQRVPLLYLAQLGDDEYGLYTSVAIPPGVVVRPYAGIVTDITIARSVLYQGNLHQVQQNSYLLSMPDASNDGVEDAYSSSKTYHYDAWRFGNILRWANTSDHQNLQTLVYPYEGLSQVVAATDAWIGPHSELTIPYGENFENYLAKQADYRR